MFAELFQFSLFDVSKTIFRTNSDVKSGEAQQANLFVLFKPFNHQQASDWTNSVSGSASTRLHQSRSSVPSIYTRNKTIAIQGPTPIFAHSPPKFRPLSNKLITLTNCLMHSFP